MAKSTGRNRTRGSAASEEAADRATAPQPAEDPDTEPQGKRLGIQLGPDGLIEWDRLRTGTREELRRMLTDPRIAAELGVSSPAMPTGEAIPTSTVGMLYGAFGSLMVGAATALGYTPESAAVLQFTPDERAQLLEPTAKVLSKYAGALGKYEDEILLCLAVGSVMTPKLMALKKKGKVIAMAPRAEPTPAVEPSPDPALM